MSPTLYQRERFDSALSLKGRRYYGGWKFPIQGREAI